VREGSETGQALLSFGCDEELGKVNTLKQAKGWEQADWGEAKTFKRAKGSEPLLSFSCDEEFGDSRAGPHVDWDASTEGTGSMTADSSLGEWEGEQAECDQTELRAEMEAVQREQKATKADDAEVSEFLLWASHLVADGPTEWSERQQKGLEMSMKVIRERLLCRWARRLLRSFWTWMKEHHCDVKTVSAEHHSNLVSWNTATQSSSGERKYCRWWVGIAKDARTDFEAGGECISRAARSTWWAWDDGSRPFFWRWPKEYLEVIRDGLPIHLTGKSPRYVRP
jgi:hypothetical protein